MSWKSGMRAIDKLERLTVVTGTLKQELLKRQYVIFGSECVKIEFCIWNSNIGFIDYSLVQIICLFVFIYLSLW